MSVYDGRLVYRKGEKAPAYASVNAPTDAVDQGFTVSTATMTFTDMEGEVVGGHQDEAVTGSEQGEQTEALSWYNLDTADIARGRYLMTFTIQGTGSDNIERTLKPILIVRVI